MLEHANVFEFVSASQVAHPLSCLVDYHIITTHHHLSTLVVNSYSKIYVLQHHHERLQIAADTQDLNLIGQLII